MSGDAVDRSSPDSPGLSPTVERGMPPKLIAVIGMVRSKMRDYPELNRLVAGQETSDRQIAMALLEAIDDFNTTPPLIEGVTLDTYPSVSLLVNGTLIFVLQSVGLLQTRNMMNYSDGQGVQTGVNDKAPMLMQWIQLFTGQYEQKKMRLKQAMNLNGALNGGGVPSEYAIINGYFDQLT
jgi:hypothetical protein